MDEKTLGNDLYEEMVDKNKVSVVVIVKTILENVIDEVEIV